MNLQQFLENRIPINEIFSSISGEGISAGSIMSLVRTAGCNLRCRYCDTTYSYSESENENKMLYPDEVVDILLGYRCRNVLCTGGEPLEQDKPKRYLPLYIAAKGFNVRVETNGSCLLYNEQEIQRFLGINNKLNLHYSMDIKCPDSGEESKNIYDENLRMLNSGDEVKFIVSSDSDMEFALDIIDKYKRIFALSSVVVNFSPAFGKLYPTNIVEMLKKNNEYFEVNKLRVRLSLQIHKFIWSKDARGV